MTDVSLTDPGVPCSHSGMNTDTIHTELADADDKFKRPAVPTVYAEYVKFVATGAFPYIDSVVVAIADTFDIGDPALRGWHDKHAKDPALKQLSHEVYLSSGQHLLAKMVESEAERAAEGYRPITELVFVEGAKILLYGNDKPYRMVPCNRWDGDTSWALLAPRKRTNGVDLTRLVASHRAYVEAKERGQTANDGPKVVMYRDAK